MSAFLCSDLHTYTLAAALCARGAQSDIVSAAMLLRDANNKALAARYRDPAEPLGPLSAVKLADRQAREVNTLARCFAYQCSEGDVMETHRAAPMLRELIEATGGQEVETVAGLWGI